MATVVVRAERPDPGFALEHLAEKTPLTPAAAATLYRRAIQDVCAVVESSSASLLVTYPDAEPDDEQALRDAIEPALEDPASTRFEPQVGSTPAARLGNTVTHLLESADKSSVGIVEPTAVLLTRRALDQATMTLRRHEVVVGPASEGGIYYAGFTDPVDFTATDQSPMVETVVERAEDAGLSADVLSPAPTLATAANLRSLLPILHARGLAGRQVPERTNQYLESLGLGVFDADEENQIEIVRD